MSLRLVNWNVEWAKPESPRGAEVLRRVHGRVPELVCLTETYDGLLSHNGHTICSQPDYGYTLKEDRRKVMLWSMEQLGNKWELYTMLCKGTSKPRP